jgi:hypothetical protein
MAKFIELIGDNDEPMTINVDHIVYWREFGAGIMLGLVGGKDKLFQITYDQMQEMMGCGPPRTQMISHPFPRKVLNPSNTHV